MSRWFLMFFFYSLAGCGLEKLYARAIRSPRRTRKCFLLLPLCPVYGLAMVCVLALAPAEGGLVPLAVLGGAVCTGVEYAVHLFYERALGVRFWDYSQLPGHIRGRICPRFAVIWGVLSAAAVRLVQPALEVLAALVPPWLTFLLWMVLAADSVFTWALLARRHDTNLLALRAAFGQTRASSQSSTSL